MSDSTISRGSSSQIARPQIVGYGIAVLAVAVALVVKLILDPLIGRETPFLVFFGAVMASAWYGGRGPGLLATLLAAFVADYFFSSALQFPINEFPGRCAPHNLRARRRAD